jgi:5-methyltetrahydrofolate--homocysteine methyltransferase
MSHITWRESGAFMKETILEALQRGALIVADGAMGTMLQRYDLPVGMMPELCNAERPEILREIHQAYLDAGAQIITANTFGGNRVRMGDAGLAERSVELTRLGVALAREIAGDRAWVAGDMGPTGQIMEPYGTLTESAAEEAFTEQAVALAEAGADLILIETQHSIEEAVCAVRMAKAHTKLPVFCTFAFNAQGRTMMGLRPGDAATRVQEAGADGVGANCGDGPAAILAALKGMQLVTHLPLIAQSNAGIPHVGEGAKTVWDVTPTQLAEQAQTFVALGARIVGGCCGTGPQHIAVIAAALQPK